MSRLWYLWRDDKKWGPYSQEQFQEMVNNGTIQARDLVWHEELAAWTEAKKVIKPSPKSASAPQERSAAARTFVDQALRRMKEAEYTVKENVTWKGANYWVIANQVKPATFLIGATDCTFFFETIKPFEFRRFSEFIEVCRACALGHQENPKAALWYFPVAITERLTESQVQKIYERKPDDYTDAVFSLPGVYEEQTGYLYYYSNPVMLSWEARHHETWVIFSNLLCKLLLGK